LTGPYVWATLKVSSRCLKQFAIKASYLPSIIALLLTINSLSLARETLPEFFDEFEQFCDYVVLHFQCGDFVNEQKEILFKETEIRVEQGPHLLEVVGRRLLLLDYLADYVVHLGLNLL